MVASETLPHAGSGAAEESPDRRLVEEVVGGSHDALAELYDRHHIAVFTAAARTTGDRSLASDVVQETFLALWNRAEQFDPARGSLRAWLLTIARNRAVDQLRARQRHHRAAPFSSFRAVDADDASGSERLAESGSPVAFGSTDAAPEQSMLQREAREGIAAALGALSPRERTVVELAYGAGLSQSEIASHLGWPIGTVKTRTRRALRLLREQLEPAPGRPALPVPAAIDTGTCCSA